MLKLKLKSQYEVIREVEDEDIFFEDINELDNYFNQIDNMEDK